MQAEVQILKLDAATRRSLQDDDMSMEELYASVSECRYCEAKSNEPHAKTCLLGGRR